MENLIISVHAILPMFLVMALGYGARCLGWIRREEILNINRIAFRIFLPCLLFYNVYCSDLSQPSICASRFLAHRSRFSITRWRRA